MSRPRSRSTSLALVRLTHAALGPMVARGSGGVINVSSISAYQPIPLHATYGATKAFVSSFTNAVHEELRGTGVKAMVLAPGYTRTGFQADGFDPEAPARHGVAAARGRGRDGAEVVRPWAGRVRHRGAQRRHASRRRACCPPA